MFRFFSFLFALNILLLCHFQIGLAVVFDEYDPYRPSFGNSNLDLQSAETFFWIGPQNGTLGNFTVSMPGDDENIIAVNNFRYLLKSIQCTNSSVTLTFNDNSSYSYAKDAWQWVNVEKNNTFVLIAGKDDCGWNTVRQPFVISTITFDDSDETVNLQGSATTWKNVAHSYELWVGKMPSLPSKFKTRDLDKSFNIDFNRPLPASSWTFPLPDGSSFTVDCVDCGTHGTFNIDLHVTQNFFGFPNGASISLTANGVGASITPQLGISANFTKPAGQEISLGKIPVDGINFPGPFGEDILDLGPEIFFSAGYSLGPVQGSAQISAGISISIPDNSNVNIELLSPSISTSGWVPTVTHIPPVVSGQISASVEDYVKAGVELAVEFLGNGLVASVFLRPFLGASLSIIDSIGAGACSNDPENHPFGVNLSPSAGINLEAELDEVVDDTPTTLANVVIASITASLQTACFGFGPTDPAQAASLSSAITAKVAPTNTAAPSITTLQVVPIPTDSPVSTCTNNAGAVGTCISTSDCSNQGGSSEAGHCPGAADIQCCTPTECTNNAGALGTCITTDYCIANDGTYEAGYCPGPANVQCCVT